MAHRTANDVQTGVRLPAQLYERLQQAAGERPVSEEIRKRLADSFAGPAIDDPRFHDIMAAIGQAAAAALQTAGSDANGPYGYFAAAVPYLLAVFQPKDTRAAAEPGSGAATFGAAVDDWLATMVASSALSTMGRTDLLARLEEVARRRYDSRGMSRPSDPLLHPQDYEGDKP